MKEGWEYKKLGEIATEMYRGSGIKRDQVTKEGTPCVRYGEIYTTYNISFNTCVSHTSIQNIASPKYFEHGDLLFAITGESVEDIGKTIAYLGNDKCLCGGDIICMKHRQNPKYLAYALSTPDAIRQKGIGKTKLKVVHTNAPALKAISIPLAPLSEQQSIVDYLDSAFAKIDAMKANAEKALNEAKALFQASLKEMLEPKEGWEEKTIEHFARIVHGKNQKEVLDSNGSYPIYGSGGNIMGYANAYLCEAGTTILGRKGTIDNPLFIDERFWNVDTAFGIIAKDNCNKKYLYYSIKKVDWAKLNTGTTLPSLTQNVVYNVAMCAPPLSEQQSIVETLDSLKSKVDRLQENCDKISQECDALKQAILRQVFE